MKKKLITILLLSIVVINFLFFIDNIEVAFIKAFKLDREIKPLDKENRIDGKYLKIEKGVVLLKGNYRRGFAEGTFKTYYPSGKIKNVVFYKNNKVHGVNYGYYENGNLNYKIYNLDGLYGDSFHYDENGELDVYGANDIEHSFFYYSTYKDLSSTSVIGSCFSENIYTYNDVTRERQILIDNTLVRNEPDLYITVARPPGLSVNIMADINGKKWQKSNPKYSTILLRNAFRKSGKYSILIIGELIDKKGLVFKKDTLKVTVKKI